MEGYEGGLFKVRPIRGVLFDLGWGVYWGLCGSLFYSLFASGVVLAGLAEAKPPLQTMVFGYFMAGAAGGAALGLLRPLTKTWWGSAIVGAVVTPTVWLAALMVSQRSTSLAPDDLRVTGLLAVVAGPLLGVGLRHRITRMNS